MDFVELFYLIVIVGLILYFLPAFISAFQSRKENELNKLEEQTLKANEQVAEEISNILDAENDFRNKEQVDIYICGSCGYVNVVSHAKCSKCQSGLYLE